ncbi:MAG: hypothetical protein AB7R67_05155 [Vicinamibacterales bacterium]
MGIASGLVLVSVLSGAAPAVAGQAAARDACTVLTLAELSAAAGVTVQRPRPTSAPDGSTCRFRAGTETLTLAIAPGTRADFDAFRKLLGDEGKTVEPVAGIGVAAYFWDNRIYALAGAHSFSVQVGEFAPANPARRQQARAVAAAVAAKLQ